MADSVCSDFLISGVAGGADRYAGVTGCDAMLSVNGTARRYAHGCTEHTSAPTLHTDFFAHRREGSLTDSKTEHVSVFCCASLETETVRHSFSWTRAKAHPALAGA